MARARFPVASHAFLFDRFRLDPRRRQLWDGDTPLPLGARAFDLLLALLESPERALTRDELFARAWPDRIVGDENLKMQVMALRRALGTSTIVTVPRIGYRIGCAVQRVGPAAEADATETAAPPASLYGRADAWQAAREALAAHRLVTLTGPGGIGKSRLAAALADAEAAQHPDGVLRVALADQTDGAALPVLLARAARLAESPAQSSPEGIARALKPLALLVVLDNCEHLLDAAAALAAALLREAPQVRLLATSQQPIGLPQEVALALAPLPARSADGGPGPAMQLFAARAAAADPSFRLDAARGPQVAAICERLDGLPLAIELAAARVPLLGTEGIARHLGAPLALLARPAGAPADGPVRHRTLRDALRWSVDLLDPGERRLFARLGVFVGGCDADAAAAIDADDDAPDAAAAFATFDRLASLAAKSLLQVEDAGTGKRHRLLEGARALALELLEADGQAAAVRARHARWIARRFEAAEAGAFGQPLLAWTAPLLPDLPNLRAALGWALSEEGRARDAWLAPALLAAGAVPWTLAGLDDEARRLLDRAADLLAHAPPALAARGWLAMANRGTDFTMPAGTALAAARRAAALFREAGDAAGAYRSLAMVIQHGQRTTEPIDADALIAEMRALEQPGWTSTQRRTRRWAEARQLWRRDGDWVAYRDAFRREVVACREAGNTLFAWQATQQVVLAEVVLDRPREAAALAAAMADEIRAAGQERRQWPCIAVHALACIATGDPALATPAVRATLPLLRLADALWWLGDHLAWWLAQTGQWEAAARTLGWMQARRRRRGEPQSPQSRRAVAALDALLEGRLAPATRAELEAAGATDSSEDIAGAVLLALDG